MYKDIADYAERTQESVASAAKTLLMEAMKYDEDFNMSKLAEQMIAEENGNFIGVEDFKSKYLN
ncbi:MAG: hypothetical protein COV36_03285 [Alphaproteobacteria bacterium CG11_big_fil_rev_8_21_14_0_20_44_7]|nr:MAG: hypothetical protein COV36_03285 [Alphaproteobacteria bacterium CG11_big_fil_rev_8_21_14_0_20_44_7]